MVTQGKKILGVDELTADFVRKTQTDWMKDRGNDQ